MKQYKDLVNEERLGEFKSLMKRYIAKVMSQQGGGTIRPATIVVAASNSRNKTGADYVCTGTNDHTVINNAINALPSGGGKVLLLEGTYNIGGTISIAAGKDCITLEGTGKSTQLIRNSASEIIMTAAWGTELRNLSIDGNKDSYNNASSLIVVKWGGKLDNLHLANCAAFAISAPYAAGDTLTLTNSSIESSAGGVNVNSTHYTVISDCRFSDLTGSAYLSGYGASYALISNNIFSNIKANAINIPWDCHRNIISGNTFVSCTYGVVLIGKYNTVSNNYFGITDTSTQNSICVGSSSEYNLIANNNMPGKNYINENSGTTNTFVNNKS